MRPSGDNMIKSLNIDEEALQIFANRVKLLRKERNVSMEKLSKYIGFSRSAISMYGLVKELLILMFL